MAQRQMANSAWDNVVFLIFLAPLLEILGEGLLNSIGVNFTATALDKLAQIPLRMIPIEGDPLTAADAVVACWFLGFLVIFGLRGTFERVLSGLLRGAQAGGKAVKGVAAKIGGSPPTAITEAKTPEQDEDAESDKEGDALKKEQK